MNGIPRGSELDESWVLSFPIRRWTVSFLQHNFHPDFQNKRHQDRRWIHRHLFISSGFVWTVEGVTVLGRVTRIPHVIDRQANYQIHAGDKDTGGRKRLGGIALVDDQRRRAINTATVRARPVGNVRPQFRKLPDQHREAAYLIRKPRVCQRTPCRRDTNSSSPSGSGVAIGREGQTISGIEFVLESR